MTCAVLLVLMWLAGFIVGCGVGLWFAFRFTARAINHGRIPGLTYKRPEAN
jgi:hypothetical protein